MFYQRLIISYLEEFGSASRQDINKLLFTKLGDMLTDDEKNKKVGNLLTSLRREGRIFNAGSRRYPEWELKQGFSADRRFQNKKWTLQNKTVGKQPFSILLTTI